MESIPFQDVADMNEVVVENYFNKQGFTTTRLDDNQNPNPPSACDWLVQSKDTSFLCELKTINSVQRGVSTQADFRKFENQVRDYFSRKKGGSSLPFHLHFHSDTLSLTSDALLYRFLKNVSDNLGHIHTTGSKLAFPVFTDLDEHTSLCVTQSLSGELEIEVSSYGGLNVETIEGRVSDAVSQLRASGKNHPNIARIIVLSFASQIYITGNSEVVVFDGLEFKGEYLWRCIETLLSKYDTVSAIAIMSEQADPHFFVYHNRNVKGIELLNRKAFDDGVSVQFDSFDAIPRSPIRKLQSLEELVSIILSDIKAEKQQTVTIADYQQMRTQRKERASRKDA